MLRSGGRSRTARRRTTGERQTRFVWADLHTADGSEFPGGIDYDRWTEVVQPSPRDAFADRLDLLDILDED